MEGVQSRYFSESGDALTTNSWRRWEKTLRAGTWLPGEAFSLADIAYAPYITRLDHLQLSPSWGHRPHVAEWYTRLQGRKGYQEGLVEWFNPRYLFADERRVATNGAKLKQFSPPRGPKYRRHSTE